AAKVRILPRNRLMEVQSQRRVVALTKSNRPAVKSFDNAAVPRVDRIEIVELRHAAARRRQVPLGAGVRFIERSDIEDISKNHPPIIELSRRDSHPHAIQSRRIVDLITVHAKDPCWR